MECKEKHEKMRVYLDNCCYNRPYDEQGQLRVRLETEAKLEVQARMRSGELEYIWSDMLLTEAMDNPDEDRREKILSWCLNATVFVHTTPEVRTNAELLMEYGVKSADAIHIASAAMAKCDWFLTVDKGILKKINHVGTMRIANPMEYIQEEMP